MRVISRQKLVEFCEGTWILNKLFKRGSRKPKVPVKSPSYIRARYRSADVLKGIRVCIQHQGEPLQAHRQDPLQHTDCLHPVHWHAQRIRQDRCGDSMIKHKVIKAQADYKAALAQLESLMDARPGTR